MFSFPRSGRSTTKSILWNNSKSNRRFFRTLFVGSTKKFNYSSFTTGFSVYNTKRHCRFSVINNNAEWSTTLSTTVRSIGRSKSFPYFVFINKSIWRIRVKRYFSFCIILFFTDELRLFLFSFSNRISIYTFLTYRLLRWIYFRFSSLSTWSLSLLFKLKKNCSFFIPKLFFYKKKEMDIFRFENWKININEQELDSLNRWNQQRHSVRIDQSFRKMYRFDWIRNRPIKYAKVFIRVIIINSFFFTVILKVNASRSSHCDSNHYFTVNGRDCFQRFWSQSNCRDEPWIKVGPNLWKKLMRTAVLPLKR